MTGNELITVIVPIYNVAEYLPRCLDSIVRQTYENLEIILVDDGSTDDSGTICDEYSKNDRRIRVIYKENGGLSSARNAALDIASGDAVTFIDGDDAIHSHYVEVLLNNMTGYGADIASIVNMRVKTIPVVESVPEANNIREYTPESAISAVLYQDKMDNSMCGKLFRRELFENVRFPDGALYEDLATFYRVFELANSVVWNSSKLYYYLERESSIIGCFSLRRLDVLDVVDEIEVYMADNHPTLLGAAKCRKLSANFNMLMLLAQNGYSDSKYSCRCWQNIKSLRWSSLCNKNVRIKNKIGILASYSGKILTQKLLAFFG